MRLLFVKPLLAWPRTSGHDVYCYYMMKGLSDLGAEVSLATVAETDSRAVDGIKLAYCGRLSDIPSDSSAPLKLTSLQERFRSFWGVNRNDIEAVRRLVEAQRADVIIAFGLPTLPFLAGAGNALRVWAMADEWVYHHLTLVRPLDPASWQHLKSAAIKGLYERAFRSLVDRVWAVSDTDRRAARWFAGMRTADLLPNGVDADFFHPVEAPEIPNSAVFWGRLDFEPNIDAVLWFVQEIWPRVLDRIPDARFTIIGYQPTPQIERLAGTKGITLLPNVNDLRTAVCEHALVVLPMISGGGIKNKLLEGAAMGRPIVCTPRAAMDLRPAGALPLRAVTSASDWVNAAIELWKDKDRRIELGRRAREWVIEYYSWTDVARRALETFNQARNADDLTANAAARHA